jgi:hypothetical protein
VEEFETAFPAIGSSVCEAIHRMDAYCQTLTATTTFVPQTQPIVPREEPEVIRFAF